MGFFQASNLRNGKLEKLNVSILDWVASVGARFKTTTLEFLHFADAPTRQEQAAGFLTRKQHELWALKAYDAFRAVLIFFLHIFTECNHRFSQNQVLMACTFTFQYFYLDVILAAITLGVMNPVIHLEALRYSTT